MTSLALLLIVLAGLTAAIYLAIAAYIVPRIDLDNAGRRVVLAVKLGAGAFFLGCALSNAVKFTERGEVTISVEELERLEGTSRLRFSVCDTRIGVPESQLDDIFDAFSQGAPRRPAASVAPVSGWRSRGGSRA